MLQIKRSSIFLLLLFAILSCTQAKQSDELKILFIGNSYTYFNSLPELVKGLAEEQFPERTVGTQLVSQGGMTLEMHWQEGDAVKAIKSEDWDFVVLQEQSKLGMGVMIDNDVYFGQTDLFFEYARKLDAEIEKAGAETVFFMTWSTKNSPEEQKILTHAYTSIAKELEAIVAPVGLVWDQLRTNKQFDFYSMDGSHPSPEGSYLAATTLLATMLDTDPTGLSGNLSGKKLSSRGVPSMESQPLVDIPAANAKEIQTASWAVVQALQKQGGYPEVEQPKPSYTLPVLAKGEPIDRKSIEGRWYGTSSYGFNYLGLILDVAFVNEIPEVSLSYYSPDREDRMTVQETKIEEDQLKLTIYDSLRTLTTQVDFSLANGQFSGLSTSIGARLLQYRHWGLSREKIQNDIDLEAAEKLIHTFQKEALKEGYVKAAIKHYAAYSKLIGEDYLPEERYLNAEGYNLMREKKLKDALDIFELNMTLYPESVNTYDSYGEGLIAAGQKEKALKIYTKAYELAKKTNYKELAYIEGNMRKLEEELK